MADVTLTQNIDDFLTGTTLSAVSAAAVDKSSKCQLWVNNSGDLYLTLPDGTDKQIAFV